ncbi:hypothetical protein JCM8097_006429 [Rhodosporidiobolus ruineniae]
MRVHTGQALVATAALALAALAQPPPQHPNQVTFGLTQDDHQQQGQPHAQGGAGTGGGAAGKGSEDEPLPLTFSPDSPDSSHSSLTASDLYSLSLSLLDTITAHSLPPSPAPYPPALQPTVSSLSFHLDALEDRLAGTTTGAVLRGLRRSAARVYAGDASKRKVKGGRDWSVGGVVRGLKGVVESFAKDTPRVVTSSRRRKGEKAGWKERLRASTLKGGVVLDEEETAEGMKEVVALARQAGEKGSAEGWLLVGDLYLSGHLALPANTTAAAEAYTRASEDYGSPEAQYKLGFIYSSSFGGAFGELEGKGEQGSALLHYTFAALGGNVPGSMTVGYRHWAGIGTKQSCKEALPYYKAAAEAAMRSYNGGPPGGRHLPPPKIRLSDLQGGPYGAGASSTRSVLSTGGSTAQTQQEWDNLIEFHLFHAEHGDAAYMFRLGRIYYQGFGAGGLGGVRNLPRGRLTPASSSSLAAAKVPGVQDGLYDGGRDFRRASHWFLKLARKYWPSTDARDATWNPEWGPVVGSKTTKLGEAPKVGYYDASKDKRNEKLDEHAAMVAGLAAGYLGKMYLRGEGVGANYAKAFLWFQRGSTQGDRESVNGLGIMYRDGLGVERDLPKANAFFHAAAQQDHAEAQVNLGKYHFGVGDFVTARTYFEHAIRQDDRRLSDPFQSYFYLAALAERSSAVEGGADSCPVAVSFYKRVAEIGDWDHEVWWEAERARERGDERTALLGYWIMAERGYEVAQNNVAWLLDRDKTRLRVPVLDPVPPPPSRSTKQLDRLALAYWTRSAAQDNVDALVKMGDYYYAGIGTEDGLPQLERAAGCYQSAATSRFSAISMFNLGWMHETGQGVPQDFHLAKRFYDMAYETSPDAYFPSTLSLLSLYSRALYHVFFGSPEDEQNALSLFGKDPNPDDHIVDGGQYWGFGRAWRDVQRGWGIDPGPEPEAIHHQAEQQRQGGAGGEEHGEAAAAGAAGPAARDGAGEQQRRGVAAAQRALEGHDDPLEWGNYGDGRSGYGHGRAEDEDDEFYIEDEGDFGGTVAIVALCMLLAWLLYFRQRNEHQPVLQQAAPPPAAPAQQPQPPPPPPAANPAPAPAAAPPTPDRQGGEGENERDGQQQPQAQ